VTRILGRSLIAAAFAVAAASLPLSMPGSAFAIDIPAGAPTSEQDLDLPVVPEAAFDAARSGHPAPAADARRGDASYGGLPEPAGWLLMLIGVAMIGGALRGFFVASRALARLQPEDQD
jgi:hypothetical protein